LPKKLFSGGIQKDLGRQEYYLASSQKIEAAQTFDCLPGPKLSRFPEKNWYALPSRV